MVRGASLMRAHDGRLGARRGRGGDEGRRGRRGGRAELVRVVRAAVRLRDEGDEGGRAARGRERPELVDVSRRGGADLNRSIGHDCDGM